MNITSLGLAVDSSQVKQAATELDRMAESGAKAEKAVVKLSDSSDAYTRELNNIYRASKQTRQVQVELNAEQERFITKLQRQIETVGLSKAKLLEFQAAELGVTDTAKGMIAQLEAATAAHAKNAAGAHGAGAALDGFSLKSAQAKRELVVMLREAQRGDFNRLASSASLFAQASGLMALAMSPVGASIAAVTAAVGALGVAYTLGAAQSHEFAQSQALTGNFAGITEGQFNRMADSVAKATDSTIGSARAIVGELVRSGRFGSEAIEITAKATELLARTSGKSSEDIVKDFIGMTDGVARWAEKSNESYHFLTPAQLEHIRNLEEQGKKQQAVTITMQALTAHLPTHAANLGLVERAWHAISEEASGAINAMMGIGRVKTSDSVAAGIEAQIRALDTRKSNNPEMTAARRAILVDQLATARKIVDAGEESAKASADKAKTDLAGIEFAKLRLQYQSQELKMAQEIKEANAKADAANASPQDRAKVIAGIRDKYTFARTDAKAMLALQIDDMRKSADTASNVLADAQKVVDAQHAAGLISEGEYYGARRAFVDADADVHAQEIKNEIALLEKQRFAGKTRTVDQAANTRALIDLRAKLAKVERDATTEGKVLGIQQTSSANRVAQSYRNAEDAAQDYIDSIRRVHAAELAGIGQGNQVRSRNAGLAQVEDKYESQRRDLEKSRRDAEFNGTFTADAQQKYYDEIERIKRFKAVALREYGDYYDELIAKQQDWGLGASEALANYLADTNNVAKKTEDIVTKAFKGMEDAITNMVMTGKLDFHSLATSIIADMVRIKVQQNITRPLAELTSGAGIGNFFSKLFSAKGNSFGADGVHAYANGGTFTNTVVNTPTPFAFAKGGGFGLGVMGEAGDEAVMPLTRDSAGRLGVKAQGGGGGGDIIVNQPLTINAPGATAETVGQIRALMPAFIAENSRVVYGVVQQAMQKRGGRINA